MQTYLNICENNLRAEEYNLRLMFVKTNTALTESRLPGLVYALNPYIGCEHGCVYCYAPSILRRRDFAQDWGYFIKIKKNLISLLKKELKYKKKGIVGLGTVTDPYQPVEIKFQLTRKCLQQLYNSGFPVCIQTKSETILRDIDIIEKFGSDIEVGITITTMSPEISKRIEIRASSPEKRIYALKKIHKHGIRTFLFIGPLIYGITTIDDIKKILDSAKNYADYVMCDRLHIKEFSRLQFKRYGVDIPAEPKNWFRKMKEYIKKIASERQIVFKETW